MSSGPTCYLTLSDAELLDQCGVDTFRASGPGGQKRNKTASAVRLRHLPTGLTGLASESRSQHDNKRRAVRRLRQRIAAQWRQGVALEAYQAPEPLATLISPRRSRSLAREGAQYAHAVAQLLDLFVAADCSVRNAADYLDLGSAALCRLLAERPWVHRSANQLRAQRGLGPLTCR